MTRFEFAAPHRIIFGSGTLQEAIPAALQFGKRAILVAGSNPTRCKPLASLLTDAGFHVAIFSVSGEPVIATIEAGVETALREKADLVIGFGGGSALDAGKAIAAMLTNPGSLHDHLEVIGRGLPFQHAPAPFIAIPTTAGTGSEATRNAVLASPSHSVKVSLRHPLMLPKVAIVDPDLLRGTPPNIAASTGLDAITQLLEPFVCSRTNPIVDALCRDGLIRAGRSIRAVCSDLPTDAAREDMALASLFGGMALANAGLGAVHGFAGPIGGMFPAPHGAVCAALLPHATRINLRALQQRHPGHPSIDRYAQAYAFLSGNRPATPELLPEWLVNLVTQLHIPGLATHGVKEEHFPVLIQNARQASSMKANPVPLTDAELGEILKISL